MRVLDPGGRDGAGRRVALHTRGRLPYTLRWQARMVEDRRPHGWTIEATGDLVGRGVWRLEQRGELVAVRYDWQVAVEKPLLRPLTPILRPVYAANHRWAMARGFEGLNRGARAPGRRLIIARARPRAASTPRRCRRRDDCPARRYQ